MEKDKWKTSTTLAVLSGITKPIGFIIFIPLLYKAIFRVKNKKTIVYSLFACLSPLIFMSYSYFQTGNLFAYLHAQNTYWYRGLSNPISMFMNWYVHSELLNIVIGLPIIVAVFLSFIYFRKQKEFPAITPYYLYSLALLVVYIFSGPLFSFPRYALTLILIYWFMAYVSLNHKFLGNLLLIGSVSYLIICTSMFVNWYAFC